MKARAPFIRSFLMYLLLGSLRDVSSPAFGIVFGLLLGLLYGVASFAGYKIAVWVGGLYYTAVVFGGMLLRMTFFLAVIALAITFFDVDEFSFVGAFFLTFVFVLAIEVVVLNKAGAKEQAERDADRPDNFG